MSRFNPFRTKGETTPDFKVAITKETQKLCKKIRNNLTISSGVMLTISCFIYLLSTVNGSAINSVGVKDIAYMLIAITCLSTLTAIWCFTIEYRFSKQVRKQS